MGAGGWRIDAWFGLAAAFALIAMSDAIYVAAQLGGGWRPGTSNDLGYAARSLLIALAAWGSRRTGGEASPTARVALPIVFAVTAFLLVVYEAFTELDPVVVAMIRLTLLAEGTTIALLEIYRRAPQAWTNTQVDRARVLANDIAAALARIVAGPRRIRTPQPRPARRA